MSVQFLITLLMAGAAAAWFLRGALASFRPGGSCASGCGGCGKACPMRQSTPRAIPVTSRPQERRDR